MNVQENHANHSGLTTHGLLAPAANSASPGYLTDIRRFSLLEKEQEYSAHNFMLPGRPTRKWLGARPGTLITPQRPEHPRPVPAAG